MRHAKQKKTRDKTGATIALCFCLIALTSIFTVKASIDKVQESAKNLPVSEKIATESASSEKEYVEEDTPSTEEAADLPVSQEISIVDSTQSTEQPTSWMSPVSMQTGKIAKQYSMDMVIYNKTLDQYMTHPGMDFEAPTGSGVNAIADGTVTDILEDDAYGTTIEITHQGGVVSKYSNLESQAMVEKGDSVTQGQQIGTIGMSAPYESMDGCHLHFEIYENGELCNPENFIDFSS